MSTTYSDRLKLRIPAVGDSPWGEDAQENTKLLTALLSSIANGGYVESGLVFSDGGGLTLNYTSGVAITDDTKYVKSGSFVTLTPAAAGARKLNYIYLNDSGVVVASTIAPTGTFTMLTLADTDINSIERIGDFRAIPSSIRNSVLFNDQSGTSYTFVESDNGIIVNLDNASPIAANFPDDLSKGWNCSIEVVGAGQVTFSATTTLNSLGNKYKTEGQHAMVTAIHKGSNVITIAGGLIV